MLQTSGLLLTQNKDGSIIVEYEDYGTRLGGDFSSIYNLDATNATKLKKAMKQRHPLLSFKRALICEVGRNLNDEKFRKLLTSLQIHYDHYTWRS